jgi:hypothetical protein
MAGATSSTTQRAEGESPRPAAYSIVLDEASRILLHKHTDNECWSIPGGAMTRSNCDHLGESGRADHDRHLWDAGRGGGRSGSARFGRDRGIDYSGRCGRRLSVRAFWRGAGPGRRERCGCRFRTPREQSRRDLSKASVAGRSLRSGIRVWPPLRQPEIEFVTQVRDALGPDRYDQVFASGSRLKQPEAVAVARAHADRPREVRRPEEGGTR